MRVPLIHVLTTGGERMKRRVKPFPSILATVTESHGHLNNWLANLTCRTDYWVSALSFITNKPGNSPHDGGCALKQLFLHYFPSHRIQHMNMKKELKSSCNETMQSTVIHCDAWANFVYTRYLSPFILGSEAHEVRDIRYITCSTGARLLIHNKLSII
jgi:hypothetical protein